MRKQEGDALAADPSGVIADGLRGEFQANNPMARHTSWRAGGTADRTYKPADLNDLRVFMASLASSECVCFVGLGSNLLVRDGGYRGTVIFTHGTLKDIRLEGGQVYADAGVPSPKAARFAAMHDLRGAEFMAGIPGTVGGALAMNAGCYGSEVWEITESVTTIDRRGELRARTRADYDIGYRTVNLRDHADSRVSALLSEPPEEWFVGARFALISGDAATSRATIRQLLERRLAAQPLNQPNAGSVFRNPPGDFAARMIEACGLRGRTIGGAAISTKHANFIVNTGDAFASDIEILIETARDAVKRKFGVELEREVRIIGEAA